MNNTLITTYYNNPEYLILFIENNFQRDLFDELIIVDDGSKHIPALGCLHLNFTKEELSNIRLLRVKEDFGFNSHGARNLAVSEAKTKWVTLFDIDCVIDSKTRTELEAEIEDDVNLQFLVNQFKVTRKNFLKAGGYNEQLRNLHCGDHLFMHRLNSVCGKRRFLNSGMDAFGTKEIKFDPTKTITEYPNNYEIIVPCTEKEMNDRLEEVYEEFKEPSSWISNKIINFDWEDQTDELFALP